MQVKPFRPRYAMEVVSLPDEVKPETGDEAMGRSSRRTFRGERVQRAGTDQLRNLGGPVREPEVWPRPEYITAGGPVLGVGEAHISWEAR